MAKSLDGPLRGGPARLPLAEAQAAHTLDLVVLAVEWGSGRRKGWLSNLHLGARDAESGGFVMLGKTFKGLTDEMLRWQTETLARARGRDATAGSCTCGPSSSSRSPSATSRNRRTTRRASRCASRASSAIGRTSGPRRPTRSDACGRSSSASARDAAACYDPRRGVASCSERPKRVCSAAGAGAALHRQRCDPNATFVGPGTRFKGELTSDGPVDVAGTLDGDVARERSLPRARGRARHGTARGEEPGR